MIHIHTHICLCVCVCGNNQFARVQAINLVASCAESEVPGVQVGVLRAMLTALTSQRGASGTAPAEEVSVDGEVFHGEPVMIGIRVCYNIAVGSEVAANRATARSALLQLMSTVAKRASVVECDVPSETDADASTNGDGNATASAGDGVDPNVRAVVKSALANVIVANGGDASDSAGPSEGAANGDANASAKDEERDEEAGSRGDAGTTAGATVESEEEKEKIDDDDDVAKTPDASELAKLATQADVSAIEKALEANEDGNARRHTSGSENGSEHAEASGAPDGSKRSAALGPGVRDFVSVFRALAKLGARDVGTLETAVKGKVLAINLLVVLLETMETDLAELPIVKKLLKRHACVTILRNSLSTIPALQESIASLLCVIAVRFRIHLKTELGALIPLMLIRPLETDVSVVQTMTALVELKKLLRNSAVVADMFVNYDCDMGGANLYERLLSALSALVIGHGKIPGARQGGSSSGSSGGGSGYASVTPGTIAVHALHCLLSVIEAMHEWATKSAPGGQLTKVLSSSKVSSNGASEESDAQGGPGNSSEESDMIGIMKAAKTTLETGVIAFNSNPSKGIRLMTAAGIIDGTTESIAKFLRDTHGLDKALIGDYLGHHDPEKIEVLKEYANMMDFTGQHVDEALRSFCSGFRLPGEAQKIDRIVERFAERYCENNPSIFKSTDAAYVLSFAIVMLNTDAHNPQVEKKMSKAEFVGMAKDTDAEAVPQELLEGIFDRIVSNEIKLKDDDSSAPRVDPKAIQQRGRSGSSGLFSWARQEPTEKPERESSNVSALRNAREMLVQAQEEETDASSKDGFRRATQPQIVKPMMEVTGGLLLRTLQVALQSSTNVTNVVDTIHGLHTMMRIASLFDIDGPLEAAFNTIIGAAGSETAFQPQRDVAREQAIAEIMLRVTPKQCIASKMILEIAESDLNLIGNSSWMQVLRHLSAHAELLKCLEKVDEVPVVKLPTKSTRNEDLSNFNSSHGPPKYFQWLKSRGKSLLNSIFLSTKELNDESISHCVSAMIEISRADLNECATRTWLLSRLAEVTETNTWRLRMVWNRIWHKVGEFLIEVMGYNFEVVSMFALKALVHISTRALIRDKDFSHANFQADTLRYLVPAMRMPSEEMRAALVEMLETLIAEHGNILFSGWRLVFSALAVIARDKNEASRAAALKMAIDATSRMFDDISADCLPDVTNCLSTFANGEASECMLAIEALKACGVSMAKKGGKAQGADGKKEQIEKDEDEGGGLEAHFVVYGVYWIGLFVTFSELSMDRRVEVRTESLSALLELIHDYSEFFGDDLWRSVFSSAILPLLDPVRSTMEGSDESWLVDALVDRTPRLATLLADLYPLSSAFLPQLFDVLQKGAKSTVLPGIALLSAKILIEVALTLMPKLSPADAGVLVSALRSLVKSTLPAAVVATAAEEMGDAATREWFVRAVIAACEAQQKLQEALVTMAEDTMRDGCSDVSWQLFDTLEEQSKLLSRFNCTSSASRLELLRCQVLKEPMAKQILSSLTHTEAAGWEACVNILALARKSGGGDSGTTSGDAGSDGSEAVVPVCDLKHISLVASVLGSEEGEKGSVNEGNGNGEEKTASSSASVTTNLSDVSVSIVSSLDQLEGPGFSKAMDMLFLKLANLSLSENASHRQLFYGLLVGRIWPEVQKTFHSAS